MLLLNVLTACKCSKVGLHSVTCKFWPSVHWACRPHCLPTFWWATTTHYLLLALHHLATVRTITTNFQETHFALIAFVTCCKTRGFQNLPSLLAALSCALSKTSSSKNLWIAALWKCIQGDIYHKPPSTGDCTGSHFTGLVRENRNRELHIREWHLHVYLHLFTAVAEWK